MAALNFTPISLYYTTTAAATPSAGNLVNGELALNITDEKLYFKNAAGVVKLLASNAVTAPVTSFQTSLSGLTPSTSTSGAVTLAGTLGTSSGGTNLTSFTSGGVVYASSTSALATGSALTFDGANLTISAAGYSTPAYFTGNFNLAQVSVNRSPTTGAILNASQSAAYLNLNGASGGSSFQFSTAAAANTQPSQRFEFGPSGQFGIGGTPDYGSSGQVLTSGGASAAPTWSTPASGVSLSADNTWTGTQTFNGTTSKLATVLLNAAEPVTVSGSAPSSTTVLYLTQQSIVYFTSNTTNNWVTNFVANASVTLNSVLSTGQSITNAVLVTNGSTAYYNTSVQVDGTTSGVTTKWQGGSAPTSGNANSIDVYTYTIIKTASATFTVLASVTKFA